MLSVGAVVFLLVTVMVTSSYVQQEERWSRWRLPPGLDEVASLTSLELTGPVDRLDWIGHSLEELVLRGTALTSLPNLAEYGNLRRLSVQGTPLRAVGGLPADLRLLELRDTEVQQFAQGWPASIEVLELGGSDLYDPGPFPIHLRRLSLQGGEVRDLEELPPGVDHLTLVRTELAALPTGFDHLVSLELRDNPRLVVEALPDGLLSLTLRGQVATPEGYLSCGDLPPELQALRLLDDALPCPDGLPSHLIEVHLGAPSAQADLLAQVRERSNLARVRLDYASFETVASLPGSVESLELHGYLDPELPDLDGFPGLRELAVCDGVRLERLPADLPAGLEALRVCGTPVDLPALPPGLQELSLASTPIRELPELGEEVRLRKLELSGSCLRTLTPWPRSLSAVEDLQLSATDLTDLPSLPSTVRVLDISNTSVRQLGSLPRGLEDLTLHLGQVQSLHELPQSVRRLRFVPYLGNAGFVESERGGSCEESPAPREGLK